MEYLESDSSSVNSFLQETEYNSDINSDIRRQIEFRCSNSKINTSYHFPRCVVNTSKQKKVVKSPMNILKPPIKPRMINSLNTSASFVKKSLPSLSNKTAQDIIRKPLSKSHKKHNYSMSNLPTKFKKSPYLRSLFVLPSIKTTKNIVIN